MRQSKIKSTYQNHFANLLADSIVIVAPYFPGLKKSINFILDVLLLIK